MKRGTIHLCKIGILLLDRDFEHDIYELIKAFYPEGDIHSLYEKDEAYLLMLSARQIIAIEFNSVANKFISNAVFSILLHLLSCYFSKCH